jgi:hypothetical protein
MAKEWCAAAGIEDKAIAAPARAKILYFIAASTVVELLSRTSEAGSSHRKMAANKLNPFRRWHTCRQHHQHF